MDLEKKLNEAIEQSEISLMFIDKNGEIDFVNAGFTKLTGYVLDDVRGKKIDFLKIDDFNTDYYEKIWKTISGGDNFQGEIKIQKKNGDVIWEQVKFFPINDIDGKIIHFVKISEDVTNQRHMLDALVRSYDFIESIMNNINSIFVIDREKKFLQINLIFLKMSGYRAGELINKDFRFIFNKNNREKLGSEFDRVIKDKIYISNLEAIMEDKSGEEKIVSINLAPLVQDDGVVYVVGSLDDITERKQAVEKLRQKNLDIERDLQYAQMIISKLLPDSVPIKDFVHVEYRYMPLEAIGGDYFSFYDIDSNNFGVFIGDVAGHGISAALFLSLVNSETERIGQNCSMYPALFIKELNQRLQSNMTSYFLTALYALFSKDDKNIRLRFAKGGHPSPVYYSKKNDSFTYLKSMGKPISLFENLEFEEISVTLDKGDRIFLYTDGLNELTKSENEIITEEDFIQIIKISNQGDLKKTLDQIIANARNYNTESIIYDDIILVGFEIV